MAIKARYACFCPVCEERYPEGTLITRADGGWAHDSCPDPAPGQYDDARKACPECWMVGPCEHNE